MQEMVVYTSPQNLWCFFMHPVLEIWYFIEPPFCIKYLYLIFIKYAHCLCEYIYWAIKMKLFRKFLNWHHRMHVHGSHGLFSLAVVRINYSRVSHQSSLLHTNSEHIRMFVQFPTFKWRKQQIWRQRWQVLRTLSMLCIKRLIAPLMFTRNSATVFNCLTRPGRIRRNARMKSRNSPSKSSTRNTPAKAFEIFRRTNLRFS